MTVSVEALFNLPEVQLLCAYDAARRTHAEKKFARDTERARLHWLRARAFVHGIGGVSERLNAVDASEELARKGQNVREMTRDVDLLKCNVDIIATCLRMRGSQPAALQNEDETEADQP